MKFLFKYGFVSLLVATGCIFFSYWLSSNRSEDYVLTRASSKITTKLHGIETSWEQQFPDSFLLRIMVNETQRWNSISALRSSPVFIEFLKNDSAIFWNENLVMTDSVAGTETDWHLLHSHTGYFLEKLHLLPSSGGNQFKVELLLPLRYEYGTSNSYLGSQFADIWSLQDYFLIADSAASNFVPVKNMSGDTLFYLGIDDGLLKSSTSIPALIFFALGVILFLFFGYQFIKTIHGRYPGVWKFLFLILLAAGSIYFLSVKSLLPLKVSNWKIFDPSLFASTGIATSLGGLALQLTIFLWALLLPVYDSLVIKKRDHDSMGVLILQIIGNILIVFATLFSVNMIQVLVRDSKIQFSFLNPLNPDWFSILGVLCIALVLLNLWLFAWRIQNLFRLNVPQTIDQVIVILISISLGFSYCLFSEIGMIGLIVLLWTIPFTLLVQSIHSSHLLSVRFSKLFFLIVFMTASGSVMLYLYGNQKAEETQTDYATKLIRPRDGLTEFLLSSIEPRISDDSLVRRFFASSTYDEKKMESHLRKTYFSEGFSQYSIRFFALSNEDIMLNYSEDDNGTSFVSVPTLQRSMIPLIQNQLYYTFSAAGEITYLAAYPVTDHGKLIGKLYAELKVNSYKQSEVYPELLLEEKDKLPPTIFRYSYAIYNNSHLVDQSGTYSYDYHFPWALTPNQRTQFFRADNYQHLIYHATSDLIVVVTNTNDLFLNFFSYFSFLFVIMFVLVLVMLLILVITTNHDWWKFSELFRTASMRSLIHAVLMVFIIVSIVLIGYLTAQTILRQFTELEKNSAVENISRLDETLATYLNTGAADSTRYQNMNGWLKKSAVRISNIQDVDVNFYDHSGELIASSQPSIFERGYISRKINPVAFSEMKREGSSPFIQEEKIGTLNFLSAYFAFHFSNPHGSSTVYIQIPYFESQQDLNEESGLFFVTLINVLVIAMIVAGMVAPFIVWQVTNRLSLIGEQFKNVKVGKSNALIKWNANDEIGGLVESYNKMIRQLEESANRLAQSERETAWREMARQVAHEIKNPLTPMKLSIQYLIRAREKNADNLDAMIDRVSKTLIEQIDHLSQIATEFSNFAKMPHGELRAVDVHEVLQSTCELYSKQDHISLHLNFSAKESDVMADKNYLLSVFNNLVLNAIQAIPDSKRGFINVNTSNVNESIMISVSDNGVGISDEEGSKVFVPNFTTKSSGTGLGLAITKSIVEQFGGSIGFESKKYEGTTFFVKLPLTNHSENGSN